jgi:hypothetical protein
MSNVITLFHCSHETIKTIHDDGTFGSFLFFGTEPSHYGHVVHSIFVDLDEEVISAGSIFYQESARKNPELDDVVETVMEAFSVDEDTAEELISERTSIFDVKENACADDVWLMQYFTAYAAKALGFRGVAISDEYGTSYMIDMLGRENELEIEYRSRC